jgi:hypothetical protein
MSNMPVNPWDRLPTESIEAYTAFTLFLKLESPRKLKSVYPDKPQKIPLVKRWASPKNGHSWFARAEAYDADLARVHLESRRKVAAETAGDDQLESMRNSLLSDCRKVRQISRSLADLVGFEVARLRKMQMEKLDAQGVPTVEITIPSSLTSAARVSESGMVLAGEIEAMALAVDDVIGSLTRGRYADGD